MGKRKEKKEKRPANVIVVIVEGISDCKALEFHLSELFCKKYGKDITIKFQIRERVIERRIDDEDDYIDDEIEEGGDITTEWLSKPSNIEDRIYKQYVIPLMNNSSGILPKFFLKIIHVMDLDGAYIDDDSIVPLTENHLDDDKPFYDGENQQIKTGNVEGIIFRNRQKRENIDYLLSLPEGKIKINQKSIPYEAYYFSSNLDHFIHHEANLKFNKVELAEEFGLNTSEEDFISYFCDDPASLGRLGYQESWDEIRKGNQSVCRHTNLDCLIRSLLE